MQNKANKLLKPVRIETWQNWLPNCHNYEPTRRVTQNTWKLQNDVFSLKKKKTFPGSSLSGHVAPRFWVVTNKINVADVLKIDSCSYLA